MPTAYPCEVSLEEFLCPLGLSQTRLVLRIGVPPRRINEMVLGKQGMTADTALRLARHFDTSPQFWLGLQMDCDLGTAMDRPAGRIAREVKPYAIAA